MFHDIRQTVMRYVKQVDIGLNTAIFEEIGTNIFYGAKFVFGGFALAHRNR